MSGRGPLTEISPSLTFLDIPLQASLATIAMAVDTSLLTFPYADTTPSPYDEPESPPSLGASQFGGIDDDHVPMRTQGSIPHSWKRPINGVARQRTQSLPTPMLSRASSTSTSSSLKLKLEQFSSSMPEPVPEEESLSAYGDDTLDPTESDDSSSSSSHSTESSITIDEAERRSTVSGLHVLHHDPERLVSDRLEEVKRMHEQDKEFFTREIRNLRMVLFEVDANLKDRTAELEFILKERETERWEWEATRMEMERRAEMEKEELRARNRALQAELDMKARDYADAMDVLEETQKELLGVAVEELGRGRPISGCSSDEHEESFEGDGRHRTRRGSSSSECSATEKPHSALSALSRYTGIPTRVASLRKRLLQDEERFQTAYNAWSNESRHLRKVHQKQLKSLNNDLRKAKEETRKLSEENKKLASQLDSSRYDVAVARRESQLVRSETRKSREIQVPAPGIPLPQDKITLEEAMKRVQKLNMRIAETASTLIRHLVAARESGSTSPESIQEAIWLLGGESVTSQLTFIPPPSRSRDNPLLQTLLQIVLTTWSAHHVHSWDLTSKTAWTSENPLVAVYRKLAIVGESIEHHGIYLDTDDELHAASEDPAVAATWRSLARAQLKFSSSSWSQALISSMHNVLSFLGLTYTRSVTSMARELEPLLQAIRAVRESAGELIVSKELEIATIGAGARFDFRHMKDAFPKGFLKAGSPTGASPPRTAGQSGKPEVVSATCGLGLKVVDGTGEQLLALPQILREASLAELLASL